MLYSCGLAGSRGDGERGEVGVCTCGGGVTEDGSDSLKTFLPSSTREGRPMNSLSNNTLDDFCVISHISVLTI